MKYATDEDLEIVRIKGQRVTLIRECHGCGLPYIVFVGCKICQEINASRACHELPPRGGPPDSVLTATGRTGGFNS